MRIYIIGYMASGKSKLGRDLAASMGYNFFDLDELFEERYHISVPDFFEKYDEPGFRRIEHELLRETADIDRGVIATGGGTPCFFDNMRFILDHGLSVYLYWDASELAKRLILLRRKRPLLKNIPGPDIEDFVLNHIREREVYYKQAAYIFDVQKGDPADLSTWVKSQLNFPRIS